MFAKFANLNKYTTGSTLMLTFQSYLLHEKFFRGAKNEWSYGEIFIDPTPDEMRLGEPKMGGLSSTLERAIRDKNNPVGQLLVGPKYYVGAWVTSRHMFAWSRSGLQHFEVSKAIPELKLEDGMPLYIWYFPETKTCTVEISKFSQRYSHGRWSDEKWLRLLKDHPAFKSFRIVLGAVIIK